MKSLIERMSFGSEYRIMPAPDDMVTQLRKIMKVSTSIRQGNL